MQRLQISKDFKPKVLEEKYTIYLDNKEVKSYIDLLKKTWPKTNIEIKRIA